MSNLISTCPDKCERRLVILARERTGNSEFILLYVLKDGGKKRWAMFCGTPKEEKLVVDLMTQASSTKVFSHIHSKADIHGYRAVYASKLYKRYARPIESLERAEKYICRKDKAGIVYDRRAMKIVSKQLGHNRISVIASDYLHNV